MDWKKTLAIGIPLLTLAAIVLQLYHTQRQIEISEEREKEVLSKHEQGNTATAEMLQNQINNLQKQIDQIKSRGGW